MCCKYLYIQSLRKRERKRRRDLHDVGEAASSAEHERRVSIAVSDVDVAVRVEQEADDARTVVPDGHVQCRPIALASRVDVAAVTH